MPVFGSLGAPGHTNHPSGLASPNDGASHPDPVFGSQSAIRQPQAVVRKTHFPDRDEQSPDRSPYSAIWIPPARDRNDCAIPKRTPQSPVRNPQSAMSNPQTAVRHSHVRNPQSPGRHEGGNCLVARSVPGECEALAGGDFDDPPPDLKKRPLVCRKAPATYIYIYIYTHEKTIVPNNF